MFSLLPDLAVVAYQRVPVFQHVIAVAVPVLLLQLPPVFWRKYVAVVVLTVVYYALSLIQLDLHPALLYFQSASLVVAYALFLDLFLVSEFPDKTDHQPNKESLRYVTELKAFSWEKLDWALRRCSYVVRGTGWTISARSKPTSGPTFTSKSKLIAHILKPYLWQLAVCACCKQYLSSFQYVRHFGRDPDFPSILHETTDPVRLLLACACMAFQTYLAIGFFCNTAIVAALLVGLYGPEEYAPIFDIGHFFKDPSLHAFWSQVWHQLLFRNYSLCRGMTDRLFGKNCLGKFVAIGLTFALGGLSHWFGNSKLAWYRETNDPAYRTFLVFIYFFATLALETGWNRLFASQISWLPKPVRKACSIVWFLAVQIPAMFVIYHDVLRGGLLGGEKLTWQSLLDQMNEEVDRFRK
ncbi:hypothetical protein OGAPHI_006589 [Ogataea philodendri]|uniref:Wax synthase domain-containing protein n=1 Tax=Ogataea philodendri TaxID=1378263 RepID=A0A9P8NXU1_9ASCO|nr:uncharacterized protein OGAPHI_006589 [Ogataea philodendri]KAH3661182.1 hypothetical protein OGAPHI_006589 [Ogataea philodendri]